MLELPNMVPNMECRTSGIHRVFGHRGESGVHCNFSPSKRSQCTRQGKYLQSRPAVKSLSNPEASTTTLTSSSKPTFSNTWEYSRQTLRCSVLVTGRTLSSGGPHTSR